MTAFARYWIASIVWPCRPISMPRSGPAQLTVIRSSSSSTSIRPVTPIAVDDPLDEVAHLRGELAVVVARRASHGLRRDRCDHPGGNVADAEQPALALRDDLEPHGAFVEARLLLLELAQRGPLRLADGLARGLDLELHQRRAFFFRLTFRGGPVG